MSTVTFAEFMRSALYDPANGYYMTPREHFGARGDFNTISGYVDLFGQIMAAEFAALHSRLGSPDTFSIVELGPGDGDFARQVLTELRARFGGVFKVTHYVCVEISPLLREKQKVRLAEFSDRVTWCDEPAEIPGLVTGAFFSNEFFDALPVHVVREQSGSLSEVFVEMSDDRYSLRAGDISENRLREYWKRVGRSLEAGQVAEINLAAIELLGSISERLERGQIITIDYGDVAEKLYDSSRPQGTLRCFSNHQLSVDPLANVGEQDLTASVNFSALSEYGMDFGLETVSFQKLPDYLLERGLLERSAELLTRSPEKALALKQLIVPHGIASFFKILVQQKQRKTRKGTEATES